MKKILLLGMFALLLMWGSNEQGVAKEIVINDSFELQDTTHWTDFGTSPYAVKMTDVVQGIFSWCMWNSPWNNGTGKIYQEVYLFNGVTYQVEADIQYHNC
jgi:hypothetical protein